MIDPHLAESLAVCYGTEDWCGPWEVVAGLKTHCPNESESARESAALAAIRNMIKAGLIELHELKSIPNSWPPSEAAVPIEAALNLVSGPNFLKPPAYHDEPSSYWFVTTPAGERVHDARPCKL